MGNFLYSELDNPNKEFMLLAPHMYKCFKELGAKYIEELFPKFDEIQYELIKERWDNMISTSRMVIAGNFTPEQSSKIMLYTLPHVISTRTDLQTGLVKLLYGDSVDVSAVMMNDLTGEIVTCMNGHEDIALVMKFFIKINSPSFLVRLTRIQQGN
ncbi:MAG: hypothetical protein EAX96_06020 [Candidatus Lokiarchaeota archaeon]|nr:hypothetical protein [Candidatus Lokiarchaeota archaeon]